jgi:hypothetical protein
MFWNLREHRPHPTYLLASVTNFFACLSKMHAKAPVCFNFFNFHLVCTKYPMNIEHIILTLPPPQTIQPVMSMPVRRLKFETKACGGGRFLQIVCFFCFWDCYFLAGKLLHKPGAKKLKISYRWFHVSIEKSRLRISWNWKRFRNTTIRDVAKHLKFGWGDVGGFYVKFEFQC